MKKSQESLTETYINEAGHKMCIMRMPDDREFHVPLAFVIANRYLPNPTGAFIVGFKDGDITNFEVDNLYWIEELPKTEEDEHKSIGGVAKD